MEDELNKLIAQKSFELLLVKIECLFGERLHHANIIPLKESINMGITGKHIVQWSKVHNRPHMLFGNPKAVLRRLL